MLSLCWPLAASASETAGKVAVFPFHVFSGEPLDYLQDGLQDMLSTRLTKEGSQVVDPKMVNEALAASGKPLDLTLARRLADKMGADFAVYGSLSKIGSRVSLDVKILDVLGIRRPQTVFVEGVGLDSLAELCDKLAREVAVQTSGREQVAEVNIKGTKRIEVEAVKAAIATKPGGPYSNLRLDEDLRKIWKMGYFDDVRVDVTDSERGKVVTFVVQEKPKVAEIQVVGAEEIDEADIKDQLGIKPFSIYKPAEIKEAEQKILAMYRDKGYYDAKVTAQVSTTPTGDKSVKFSITEGEKVLIERIRFEGNKSFDDDELREQMSTQESGWLTWLTESNVLEKDKLDQDIQRVTDFYFNQGYMEAKVGSPEISREEDGLAVTIHVVEGPRFKVGEIKVTGELIKPEGELLSMLGTTSGNWYSRDGLRKDIAKLNDLYADQGFAYVDVRPQVQQNKADNTVNITFEVSKGIEVFFESIVITGNDRTRDYVIRRELSAAEGDKFSAGAIRRANMRLQRLNFFEDVQIGTSKGSAPDKLNLNINVKEKRTGQLSFGAGYSTQDGFMVTGSVAESNLFGRGQRLELRGQLGGSATRYTLSFTEPWLFDRPISFGIDLYDWEREYLTYDKTSVGGRLRWGFPTPLRYTRFYLYYKYEDADITDVDDSASTVIKDQKGSHTTSSLKGLLRRDTRNKSFNATEGSDNSISVEWAGDPLGGTNAFVKVIGDTGWYLPVVWDTVLVVHGRLGWMEGHSGGDLPMYEKFFLGGINTLRGFDYQSVSPLDPETNDPIGGERMALANIEFRFPLLPKAGLMGVIFYDTGNVWSADDGYDFGDLRQSVGAGIRWMSPMGPLRLEYGYVLDQRDTDELAAWEFTIGGMF